jgi:hypothetical protein
MDSECGGSVASVEDSECGWIVSVDGIVSMARIVSVDEVSVDGIVSVDGREESPFLRK